MCHLTIMPACQWDFMVPIDISRTVCFGRLLRYVLFIIVSENSPRKPAKLVLSAYVRTRSEYDKQVLVLAQFQELPEVQKVGQVRSTVPKVRGAVRRLVQVPWHITDQPNIHA